jgi:succinate-semialdehyde dehydrogenase/glutarate-semialdehyde dehydrogenase
LGKTPVWSESVLGPVVSVTGFRDPAVALELVNQSQYGLGVVLMTEDFEGLEDWLLDGLDVGNVFVNSAIHENIRLPFGGVKNSGHSRNLGIYGMKSFCNTQTYFTGKR